MSHKRLPESPQRTNRIAIRIRILFFCIPALVVAVLLVIGSLMFQSVDDDFARRLARQYSIEAAANFLSNTNPHFVLMQQLSRSTTISRWIAHEDDPENKAAAFEEIMGYAIYVPDAYLMFTAYDSLQGYDFDTTLTPEEFAPWGTLAGGEVSQWFYDTRDAEMPFSLNIQRTRPEGDYYSLYIWSNHRMYYQNRFVGVVTVGAPFEGVFAAVFGDFDEDNKRGYIIDGDGAVRKDSNGQLDLFAIGLALRPPMPETQNNPALAEALNNHLDLIDGGAFQRDALYECCAIPLAAGPYRYASITPIIGTDWSVVVLSGSGGVFWSYLPLVITAVVALMLSVILGNVLVRRIALVPLYKLTQSAAAAADDRAERVKLFGLDRNDEIGDLARNIWRAQEELKYREKERAANALNELLLDSSPVAVNVWGDAYTLIAASQASANLFGFSGPKEFIARFSEVSPEYQPCGAPSQEKAAAFVRQALETGRAQFEWMHQTLDGAPLPTEISLVRITHQGKYAVAAYVIDMRPIYGALERERAAETRSKLLLDSAPTACLLFDANHKLLWCNQTSLELFVKDPSEPFTPPYGAEYELKSCNFYCLTCKLRGRDECIARKYFIDNYRRVFPDFHGNTAEIDQIIAEDLERALKDGIFQFEREHATLYGEMIPCDIIIMPVSYSGEQATACYIRDLREEKRLKTAEDESRAKTQFLARMSHEIRTPMNVVLGVTELELQKEGHTPGTEEALLRIHNSASLLLAIINDILDLSKVEAGKMEITLDRYEMVDMILDVVQLNLIYVGSKDIKFELHVDENLPAYLVGDVFRIKQILGNILSNAFKYTDEGVVSLSVGILPADNATGDDVTIVFRVRDTGPGMTEEQATLLFDEYYRFDSQNNRAIQGSGLGMPIAYSLAKMMQGDVKVESGLGYGTIVTVCLPQKREGDDVLGSEVVAGLLNRGSDQSFVKKVAKHSRISLPYGRVLVVDDVESNLYVAEGLLRQYDLNVETVLSGAAAVEKIQAGEEYDIIFMDHMMPEMDGLEAVRIIRSMGYDRPIVALTANNLKGQAEMFMQNGFSGFISKPIDSARLDTYLMRFVRDTHTPQDLEAGLPDSLVQSFLRDVKKAIEVLEALMEKSELDETDIQSYIMQVHGMKSAPYYLGYKELSETAGALQAAAWAGDLETIASDTPRFLDGLRNMVAELT